MGGPKNNWGGAFATLAPPPGAATGNLKFVVITTVIFGIVVINLKIAKKVN